MSFECATDSELLARFIRDGDGEAFKLIVERHGPMVYRICARFCTTRHDAEDAAQYVFATLARKAGMLHARTCLAGWLHRTASHTAQRWRRSAATRRRHEQQAGALRPDFTQGGAGIDQLESLDQLQRALGALPEDYRNALILHHLEGHTVEEVAELLAAPPGTIAARLSRGRAMLRDRLAMLGLVLLGTDLDDLLLQAFIGPETRSRRPDPGELPCAAGVQRSQCRRSRRCRRHRLRRDDAIHLRRHTGQDHDDDTEPLLRDDCLRRYRRQYPIRLSPIAGGLYATGLARTPRIWRAVFPEFPEHH